MTSFTKDATKSKGRRESVKSATPTCLPQTELNKMKRMYEYAKHLTALHEVSYEVDHIIPLSNPLVCGLHVPANLQVISAEANKLKGNELRLVPEEGAFTVDDIAEFISLRDKGKFMKGVSGNMNGRPKGSGKVIKDVDPSILGDLFEQADGDAMAFLNLVLKNGKKLDLDLATGMKLARELAPYQSPRKASVETKQETEITYNMILHNPAEAPLNTVDLIEVDNDQKLLHNEDVTTEKDNDQ